MKNNLILTSILFVAIIGTYVLYSMASWTYLYINNGYESETKKVDTYLDYDFAKANKVDINRKPYHRETVTTLRVAKTFPIIETKETVIDHGYFYED